jgi:hypothetical protein
VWRASEDYCGSGECLIHAEMKLVRVSHEHLALNEHRFPKKHCHPEPRSVATRAKDLVVDFFATLRKRKVLRVRRGKNCVMLRRMPKAPCVCSCIGGSEKQTQGPSPASLRSLAQDDSRFGFAAFVLKPPCEKCRSDPDTESWRPDCQASANGGGRSGRSRGYALHIDGAPEARHLPFPISEFGAAPLALLCSGFGTHGSKPAAFHRGLTFSNRAYGPSSQLALPRAD